MAPLIGQAGWAAHIVHIVHRLIFIAAARPESGPVDKDLSALAGQLGAA